MKRKYLMIAFPALLLICFAMSSKYNAPLRADSVYQGEAVSCGPGREFDIRKDANGKYIPVLPGWGHHSYSITTESDSAQFYFNQGLNMYFSYQWGEADASFKEAARFDSGCAMAYWGLALSMGPSYNFSHLYTMKKNMLPVLENMNRHAVNTSPKEKLLIEAMNKRYSTDTLDRHRKELNAAYAESMRILAEKYPEDHDINVLYVDAIMLIHPWDFWNNDGTPKPWTPNLVEICERVLKEEPHHPAALHYYIHVTEASRNPATALKSADVLKEVMPNVAHMVHMSSHVYERTGIYAKGVQVNEDADRSMILYDSLVKVYPKIHVPHYFAVQVYCALSGNMYTKCMPLAFRASKNVKPVHDRYYEQDIFMMPMMAYVRMGKWKEIIEDSIRPNQEWPFSNIIYDFAKGMAYARTGNTAMARKHLDLLKQNQSDSMLYVRVLPFNTPIQSVRIAENILSASISFAQKKYDASISALKKAIQIEDSLIYREPKSWLIPTRQYLGAYLLKLNRPQQAETIYREDIVWNPGNGWSLLGLYQSLLKQGKRKEAEKYKSLYMQSFSEADEIPPGSVY